MIFFRKPQPIKLVNKLSDLLEENVEERFYLSKEIEDRLFYMGCRKVDRGGVKIVNSTSIGYTIAYP